jgi:hypothetical protein
MTEAEKKPSTLAVATGRWRDKLLDAAIITIPTALVTQSVNWVQGEFFAQPWQIVWVALPLVVCAFIAWRLLRRPTARRLDWRFGVFLGCYATAFALASASDLLVWKRAPIAESSSSRNWLLPVTAGDWRYWLLPDEELPPGLRVVLLDHHADGGQVMRRLFDAQIIDLAVRSEAKGVFFDVAFEGLTDADPILCQAVDDAIAAKIPIVTAYTLERIGDTETYVARPGASELETPACLFESKGRPVYRSHAMVFADVDSTVRSVPLVWDPAFGRTPLSQRVAQCVKPKSGCDASDLALPEGPLLRFIPASTTSRLIEEKDLRALFEVTKPFEGQFLFIGERAPHDKFKTPGDPLTPGVLIHASAAATLMSGHSIRRPPAWFSAFIVIAACAILAVFASQDASLRTLLIVAGLTTIAVFCLAALAIMQFRVWVDVIYAVVALWLLLPLLLAYRKIVR